MLPDLSSAHIIIVIMVALIVVGPKELPFLLRKIGKLVGKMRGMANEFRASFDEMARQSELDELRKEVEAMRTAAQTAIPHDLGMSSAGRSDAEGAYMAEWQASQAAATDPLQPGLADANTILPPPSVEHAPQPPAPESAAKPHAAAPVDPTPGEAGA